MLEWPFDCPRINTEKWARIKLILKANWLAALCVNVLRYGRKIKKENKKEKRKRKSKFVKVHRVTKGHEENEECEWQWSQKPTSHFCVFLCIHSRCVAVAPPVRKGRLDNTGGQRWDAHSSAQYIFKTYRALAALVQELHLKVTAPIHLSLADPHLLLAQCAC